MPLQLVDPLVSTLHQASKLLKLLLNEIEGLVLAGEHVDVVDYAIASNLADEGLEFSSFIGMMSKRWSLSPYP